MISRLVNSNVPGYPNICVGLVDIRDVALAHYLALVKPKAHNARVILNETTMKLEEVTKILEKELKPKGYKVTTSSAGYLKLKIASIVKPSVKFVLPRVDKLF